MSKSYMNLEVTYEYAINKLAQKNPLEISRNAGVQFDSEKNTFTVPYLGVKYNVFFPGGQVELTAGEGEVSLTVKILILHYLTTANGAPLQNKWISFKELPDGSIYIDPFNRRTVIPMLKFFADRQPELIELAQTLGAKTEKLGDTSLTVVPFPRVPITFVIYSADEEFPASGNVLFDGSAACYLPTEDFAILSSAIIFHLGSLLPKV